MNKREKPGELTKIIDLAVFFLIGFLLFFPASCQDSQPKEYQVNIAIINTGLGYGEQDYKFQQEMQGLMDGLKTPTPADETATGEENPLAEPGVDMPALGRTDPDKEPGKATSPSPEKGPSTPLAGLSPSPIPLQFTVRIDNNNVLTKQVIKDSQPFILRQTLMEGTHVLIVEEGVTDSVHKVMFNVKKDTFVILNFYNRGTGMGYFESRIQQETWEYNR